MTCLPVLCDVRVYGPSTTCLPGLQSIGTFLLVALSTFLLCSSRQCKVHILAMFVWGRRGGGVTGAKEGGGGPCFSGSVPDTREIRFVLEDEPIGIWFTYSMYIVLLR